MPPPLEGRVLTPGPPGKSYVFNFFQQCFIVFSVEGLHFFVKFIPILFVLILISGIVFLISFSDCAVIAYRNTIDFCVLFLYPANLLNFLAPVIF